MYSILVNLKEDENIELLIGSAHSLSFIYQPANILNLPLINELNEEYQLITQAEFIQFKSEIIQIYDFWRNSESHFKPNQMYMKNLERFCQRLNAVLEHEIDYISLY